MTERDVHYRTDFAEVRWGARLWAATSVADLRALVAEWPSLTDAAAVVASMTDEDWPRWRRFHRRALPTSKTPPALADWKRGYGALLIPERFLHAMTVADHYKAPFGTAWIRLREFGWPNARQEAQP